MASYDTGYEDELFQYPVGASLHCCICTNVIKDAAMCHNEHIFCRACITRHLMNFHTCPTCMQPLTVETLRQAPRGIRNLLSELKIRCEFFNRGCGKFIELGDLERHVTECGFAPAVCSNEGCQLEVNKHDLLHHETAVCELRRVQCHSCKDIRQEMDTVKVNLAAINGKLDRNYENLKINVENVKAEVKSVVAKVDLVQEQLREELNKQEESNHQLKADNAEMKKSLIEITKQLERMTQQTSHEVQAEYTKKGIAEADETDREQKVVIAGGENRERMGLTSVEMFSLTNGGWTPLQPMRECRYGSSSVVYNNELIIGGGSNGKGSVFKSVEKLSMNAVQADQSITWEKHNAKLPGQLVGHCSVVYNGRLIVIGGYESNRNLYSNNSITEISLVSPYASKLLATMPQRRRLHGVVLFGDKIVIVGGMSAGHCRSNLKTVLLYDITKNECKELAPLSSPVSEMAIVKWDDDNVIIMGGADSEDTPLNKVLMYNIKTQKSCTLPDMKYKRRRCVAAVVRDTVIVMGGRDERGNILKSVESFRFDTNTWKKLADMHEARCWATAVVC